MKPGRAYKLHRDPAAPAREPRASSAQPVRKGLLSNEQKAKICIAANAAAVRLGITGWREVGA